MPDEPKQRKRQKGIPRDELEREYPSLTHLSGPPTQASRKAWVAVFNARPDAMHSLLADYIKQVYATPGRIGQRPMPTESSVDFDSLVYGDFSELPIHEVLPTLISVSERAFCQQIHMSRTQFQRLLAGRYDPDINEIRIIAEAVQKPPTFFMEYRKVMAVAAFINLIDERPGIATSLYRQYLETRL